MTEWRAKALLKHYGHRFDYYLVEEHDWAVPLAAGRDLEFQLTPYLHFPGAMVSFDTGTGTLFSSDLFGGFVPDSDILVSRRPRLHHRERAAVPPALHAAAPNCSTAGLAGSSSGGRDIQRIAPQHGHVIPASSSMPPSTALAGIDCGVFTLADADIDLQRLLRISEAKTRHHRGAADDRRARRRSSPR